MIPAILIAILLSYFGLTRVDNVANAMTLSMDYNTQHYLSIGSMYLVIALCIWLIVSGAFIIELLTRSKK